MGIISVDLNKINLDDVNFDEDDTETIIHVRIMAWCNRFKQSKAFKKDITKELTSVTWHHTRWGNWCMLEDEKKEIKPFLIDET